MNQIERAAIVQNLCTNCDCWKGQGDVEILNQMPDEKLVLMNKSFEQSKQALAISGRATQGFTANDGSAYRLNPQNGKWEHRPPEVPVAIANATPAADDDDEDDDEGDVIKNVVVQPAKKKKLQPQTDEDYLRNAPPGIQERLRVANEIELREKEQLIGELLVNVADHEKDGQRARLLNRSVQDLRNDLSLIPRPSKAKDDAAKHAANIAQHYSPPEGPADDLLQSPVMNWNDREGDGVTLPKAETVNQSPGMSPNQVNEQELLNQLPLHMRQRVANALRMESSEKTRLIEQLTANIRDEETDRQMTTMLHSKSLDELRLLAATFAGNTGNGPSYFGSPIQSNGGQQTTQQAANAADDNDILRIPSTDWEEVRKQA